MLIISDFHDFYDNCSSLGIDKKIVFNRKKKIENFDHKEIRLPYVESFSHRVNGEWFTFKFKKHIIGFCGKIYPVVIIEKIKSDDKIIYRGEFYSYKELYSYIEEKKLERPINQGSSFFGDYNLKTKEQMNRFFSEDNWSELIFLFRERNLSTFVLGRGISEERSEYDKILVSNPKLSDYKFMKIKDSFSAFQEIYMFISGFLGVPEKNQIKISDKDMASSKGHDSVYSFKKPPGGGRWR